MNIFQRAWARYLSLSAAALSRVERGAVLAMGAFATVLLALFVGQITSAEAKPPAAPVIACPKGFFPREVRVYDQRLESDPRLGSVVIQNTEPGPFPYVTALACVRPVNGKEYEDYWNAAVASQSASAPSTTRPPQSITSSVPATAR